MVSISDSDLLEIKIKQVAVKVQRRTANHCEIEFELADGARREMPDQPTMGTAQ
jgi:inorganic triphosphatase YgiF